MANIKFQYDPNLSVKENAVKCGVSEAAIRKYIKVNNIDRRLDAKIALSRKINDFAKKHPNMTLNEMSKLLGVSINTIKKYLQMDLKQSDFDTSKVSKFDLSKKSQIIKSVSDNQTEILLNILQLFVKTETFDCDLTYSIGVFYRKIKSPLLKFDKFPQLEEVRPLEEAYLMDESSLNSIVIDLPFLIRDSSKDNFSSMIEERFNAFKTYSELCKTNVDMLNLAFNKLKDRGFLIMKTMDVCFAGTQHWISHFVLNEAFKIGFQLEDTFILVSKTKILSNIGKVQHHARKYHSYFFVFQKRRVRK